MNRRTFVKTLGVLGGAVIATGLYAWKIEPHWLEFVKRKMPVKNLPGMLAGKTLMQISDLHAGRVDTPYLVQSLQRAQSWNPDIVVYTGDFISDRGGREFNDLQEVLQYTVSGKLATVGILGNHDYGPGWSHAAVADKVVAIAGDAGITILRNEVTDVQGLNIIGIDDLWGTHFNPQVVMNSYSPTKAHIVLCHNPDVCDLDVWNGYQGWILSGHTHGGQCKPPFLPPPILPVDNKKYTAGQFDLGDGRSLYINRALGHMLPVRFNVRPEITVFELVAG